VEHSYWELQLELEDFGHLVVGPGVEIVLAPFAFAQLEFVHYFASEKEEVVGVLPPLIRPVYNLMNLMIRHPKDLSHRFRVVVGTVLLVLA